MICASMPYLLKSPRSCAIQRLRALLVTDAVPILTCTGATAAAAFHGPSKATNKNAYVTLLINALSWQLTSPVNASLGGEMQAHPRAVLCAASRDPALLRGSSINNRLFINNCTAFCVAEMLQHALHEIKNSTKTI